MSCRIFKKGEKPPENAVICRECGGLCYWDTLNQSLVCTEPGCGASYEGAEYGIEPLEVD